MNIKEKALFVASNPSGFYNLMRNISGKLLHLPMRSYPYTLQINLDSVCDLKCFFCINPDRTDNPGAFDVNNMEKLKNAIKHATYISIEAFGEPLCSPNLEAVLKTIYSWNPRGRIAMVTNGTKLSKSLAKLLTGHLADICISLNAATPETYESQMVGGEWNKTITAIRSFMEGLTPSDRNKINLHFVAHGDNYFEIPPFVDLASRLGIKRVAVDQFTINSWEYLPLSLIYIKDEYNRMISEALQVAKGKGVSFSARRFGVEKKGLTCFFPWMASFVWADGRVAPCCANGTFFLGNAFEVSFEDVWFGKRYAEFRRYGALPCRTCPMTLSFDNPKAHVSPYFAETIDWGKYESLTCS